MALKAGLRRVITTQWPGFFHIRHQVTAFDSMDLKPYANSLAFLSFIESLTVLRWFSVANTSADSTSQSHRSQTARTLFVAK